QQDVERTVGAAARPGHEMLDHRLLRRRHLVVGERFEAVAAQADGAGVGPLRRRGLRVGDADQRDRADAGDHKASHAVPSSPPILRARGGRFERRTPMLQTFRRVVTPAAVSAVLAAATTLVYGSPQASRPAAAGAWSVGRTPAGHPDLQGVWTNYDQTPFERLNASEQPPRGPAVSTADWLVQDSPISPRRP